MKVVKIIVTVVVCLSFVIAAWGQEAVNSGALTAPSSVPRLIRFSGTLIDSHDRPVVGPAGVTFALYVQQSGGAALWMETQNVKLDEKGIYTVLLGAESTQGIPEELFLSGEARWLGVQPERQAELPRVLLVSVPYALKAGDAETLGGLPPLAFLGARAQTGVLPAPAQAATTTPTNTMLVAPQTASVGGTGTANFIPLWTNSTTQGNSLLFQKGNAVQFPATGTATSLKGFNSNALDLIASAFKSGGPASNQLFRWQAEPSGNNSATPGGTLNLLFASGAGIPAETGLSINNRGQITFAVGQAFPTVTGNETVTGNVSAAQLISTVANGTAPLNVTSTTQVPNLNASFLGGFSASAFAKLAAANTFVGDQTINSATPFYSVALTASSSHGPGGIFQAGTDGSGFGYNGIQATGGDTTVSSSAAGTGLIGNGGVGRNGGKGGTGIEAFGGGTDSSTSGVLAGAGLKSTGADGFPQISGSNFGNDGGNGVVAQGGASNSKYRVAGIGVVAYGGRGAVSGADAGLGVSANGGNATVGGFDARGGNGITATGGTGNGPGVGGNGGYGIQASGGQNGDGSVARAGYFSGDVEITGCLLVFGAPQVGTCSSDFRLKRNIQPYPAVLDKLAKLQPVSYNWRTEEYPQLRFTTARTSGLIAQEVEKVFPEMVSFDQAGFRRVNYGELPFLMLQAIRELKAQNDSLRAEMKLNEKKWKERNGTQEKRVKAAKDRQIQTLTQQVRELQKVQQRLEALEGRLARMEPPAGEKDVRSAAAR
jgi:hypothetical protein